MALDINEQYDKIYRFCYLRVKKREIAEDLTQETFLRYLEHPHYHHVSKTLELLYTIAGNLCVDEFRKQKTGEIPDEAAADEDMEENVLSDISLSQALECLSSEDREIILLRYINEVPVNTISRIYGISRFALNRRIKRILGQLKDYLGKEELS